MSPLARSRQFQNIRTELLAAQSGHGVNRSGPAGWDQAGQRSDGNKDQ
jgi:hypothetical protein